MKAGYWFILDLQYRERSDWMAHSTNQTSEFSTTAPTLIDSLSVSCWIWSS